MIEGEFKGEGVKIGVVVVRFNDFLINEFFSGVFDCFERYSVEEVDVVKVFGSFEIFLVVKKFVESGKYDVVFVFGVVVRGEIKYFDLVVNEVVKGVVKVFFDSGVLVIFGVIIVEDEF